jgi:hypothetical protein
VQRAYEWPTQVRYLGLVASFGVSLHRSRRSVTLPFAIPEFAYKFQRARGKKVSSEAGILY